MKELKFACTKLKIVTLSGRRELEV
jgi:hypothetical protein